jgi:hypothetical protein
MGKLCADQLIDKLVTLLREADQNKFDEAVEKAKQQLGAETKQTHRNDLENLFDSQIATLKDRGVPEQILEALQRQKSVVLQKASEMTICEGNIPFLPVIKPVYLGYYGLMAMVRNASKTGYIYLKLTNITDKVVTPDDLYYIYDVEDGNATLGKSPEEAEKTFKSQKRSPLTVAEVMALTTHANVLSRHNVWATGSRYDSAGYVPYVYLCDGRPILDWIYAAYSLSEWGSASLGSR